MTLRTVGVRLTAEIAEYQSKLKAAGQSTRDFKGELDKASKKGSLDKVADVAGGVGLALVGMAGYAVKSAADFDKSMSAVAAATHAPADQIAKLRVAAIQAGKDTQYSATQAADGITELSKAGVSTADILGGGLKGALALAAAGQISVGEAAQTAASAMTQFKLKGDQIPHVADLLAAGAGKAQGSVHDMGQALNQSGLVAAQFGLSVEDTTGALAEFAHAGLIGSDAGTSLKTMLLALANPTGQTLDMMHALGISFYDAQGKFIGLSGVAQVLQTRLKGLSQQQRQAALSQIFGNDAIRSASILYTDGAKGVQGWRNAVNDAGYASDTASKLTDNLAGDLERLKGSFETLAIQGGSGANSGLRLLAKSLNDIVNSFAGLPSAVSGTIVVLTAVGGATLLGMAAWIKYRKVLAETQAQLAATGPAGEKAAVGLGRVTSALGSVAMWSAIAEAVGVFFDQLDTKNVDVDKLTNSLQQFVDTGKSAGEMKNIFGDNFDNLGNIAQYAQSATSGYGKFVDSVANSLPGIGAAGKGIGDFASRLISGTDFDTAKQQMASLDTSLTQTMTTMNDSRKASDLWNKVLSQSGLDTDQLAQLLPNAYTEVGALNTAADKGKSSVGGLGAAAQNAAGATGDLGSALKVGASAQKSWANEADAAAGAARGEIGALSDLNARMKAQVNPVFGLLTAEKDLTAARKAATDAVHKYGRNSDQAKESTQKLTMAAISLQGAAGAAAGTIDGKMTPALVQTLHAAGFTDSQIKDVAKQFRQAKTDADKYAGNYAANVTITGAGKVEAEFRKLSAQQQALKSGNTIARLSGTGDGPGFAGGGWTGPGSKYQPAGVVHADEHVIQKESRQNLEAVKPGALDYMNQTGKWPGYATGGMVWPFPVDASKTKIPQPAFSAPGGIGGNVAQGGGPGYKWMEAVVRAAFPGMPVYSDYRPGAITLTGNRSYHSVGRAVDFAPSLPLAEWINLHFMRQTKELITPWQSLNIHNGQRHQYSALIENQHNFAGGNAHDHWAMANGGMITEPVFGIGASGRTYSFGENYQPERVIPQWQTGGGSGQGATVNVTFSGPVGSQYQLQTWLASSIDDLRRKGKI